MAPSAPRSRYPGVSWRAALKLYNQALRQVSVSSMKQNDKKAVHNKKEQAKPEKTATLTAYQVLQAKMVQFISNTVGISPTTIEYKDGNV